MHAVWEWLDPVTDNTNVSVAVLLLTGVGELDGQLRIRVENERFLILSAQWPSGLRDSNQLHKKWLIGAGVAPIQSYHPRVQHHRQLIREISEPTTSKFEVSARIPLPRNVSPTLVEKEYLGWKESAQRILYCTFSECNSHEEAISVTCL